MKRSAIIFLGIALYLVVIGCVVWPGAKDSSSTANAGANAPAVFRTAIPPGLPFRGAGMQIQRVDWIDKYEASIDRIAAIGGDTVLLVVDARQEDVNSSHIYLDMRATPTPEKLQELIRHAKEKKLRVIVMPIVLLDDPGQGWRGQIKPGSWDKWFDSYRDMIGHFAWVSQGAGADVLVVGSELVSTEEKLDQWTRVIAKARESFKGSLTYSANWDHYTGIPFWNQLDLIGLNSYYKLGDDNRVSIEDIEHRWAPIKADLLAFQRQIGKPLLFTEVGWCPLANAASEPWDYTKESESLDLDLQRRLYEGFFNTWHGSPGLGGFMMWEWTPGEGGPTDRGYTPAGKPAETVLKNWLAKPAWTVR